MKKLSLLFLFLFVAFATTFAQDAKKALKDATKALSTFNVGGATDETKLREAIDAIEIAITDAENAAISETWTKRGEIYNAVVTQHLAAQFLNAEHKILDADAAFKAYESYKKALGLAVKKWETKAATKGLTESVSNLNSMGATKYDAQDYKGAYTAFNAMLEVHDLLKKNGEKSTLDDPENYNNQMYITGLAAFYGGNVEDAGRLFLQLKEKGFEQAALYDVLYRLNEQSNPDLAVQYLEEGRKKFPEETSLLFTEINYYLKAGKMDILEGKLKEAIAAEPSNAALYYTLARVYVDVSDDAKQKGDKATQEEYFQKALAQYEGALKIDPEFYEAIYGIGEMYYNRAAVISQQMQELGTSRDDLKKYDELKVTMEAEFDKALPYFQASEKANPNDTNTLIALSEIYARRNQFELVTEFKQRLENVRGGGKNATSYFKNN
jgi:thioredoxin-like negative regulator of GroEL